MELCLCCMTSEKDTLQSFYKTAEISTIYNTITLINITKNDGLPKLMCTNCMNQLKNFDSFKKQCINSYKLLKNNLLDNNCVVKRENDEEIIEVLVDLPENSEYATIFEDASNERDVFENDIKTEKLEGSIKNDNNYTSDFSSSSADEKPEIQKAKIVRKKRPFQKPKNNLLDNNCVVKRENDKEIIEVTVDLPENSDYVTIFEDASNERDVFEDYIKTEKWEGSINNDNTYTSDFSSSSADEKPEILKAKIVRKRRPFQKPLKMKPFEPIKYDKRQNNAFLYRCVICNRGFHYKERFEGHMREHEGKRAAVCEFCNREYAEWSGLQKHINFAHKDEMKYICHCGKSFMYESALLSHRFVHDGPRTYICETCGKSFRDSSKLKKHNLVHTDETPFDCDLCDKKFKSSQRLSTHKIRHSGIKKFKCQNCGKAFTTRPELRTHLTIHSDIKQFPCTICEKLFRHKSQLSSHLKLHLA